MDESCETPARAIGGVEERINQISLVSDSLQGQVKTLIDRLAPITRRVITEAKGDQPINPQPAESPIAGNVRTVIVKLEEISDSISDLLIKLDI